MNTQSLCTVLMAVTLLTSGCQCEKEIIESPYTYTFQVPVRISPLRKTYNVTDTIWLEMDVTGKTLFDSKSNQLIVADTANFGFSVDYHAFGTGLTNPPGGFCDVITSSGINTNRNLNQWSTTGFVSNIGCGQQTYRTKIGFKPNNTGTYFLNLPVEYLIASCPAKKIPYYASIRFSYNNVDLNGDVFESLSINEQGGADGKKGYLDRIARRQIFVFRVQ